MSLRERIARHLEDAAKDIRSLDCTGSNLVSDIKNMAKGVEEDLRKAIREVEEVADKTAHEIKKDLDEGINNFERNFREGKQESAARRANGSASTETSAYSASDAQGAEEGIEDVLGALEEIDRDVREGKIDADEARKKRRKVMNLS